MSEKNELLVPWLRSRTNIASLVFLGIGGYFLFIEHWVHVIQPLPYLLVVGCVVMHLSVHRSHGHGDDGWHRDGQIESIGGKHEG